MSLPISQLLKKTIPPLASHLHKGQLGKICIIGGCLEYTGAPFYAGISAQRCGADLVTIICAKEAGIPIKCYSPELIVYPVIDIPSETIDDSTIQSLCDKNVERIIPILSRIDSLVIGPGAGRNPVMLETIKKIITYTIQKHLPLVLDGDALFAVTQDLSLINAATNIILTPNQMEFTRLWNAAMHESKSPSELTCTETNTSFVSTLSKALNGVTILKKGEIDVIAKSDVVAIGSNPSSFRRCGGQGDVVAGVMGIMHFWANRVKTSEIDPSFCACQCTSYVVREAANRAFNKEHRGMTALSVSNELAALIDEY